MNQLHITQRQLVEMRTHVESCLPDEGCGLLAGFGEVVREVIPVANAAKSAVRFRMDPAEQLRAFERIEANGWVLLAIFHSHPAGPDRPSVTDVAEAAYDVAHIIWSPSGGEWQAHGYSIRHGVISEVQLLVADE